MPAEPEAAKVVPKNGADACSKLLVYSGAPQAKMKVHTVKESPFLIAGLARHGLCPEDWPDGCINYAVNLVRPVQRGFRKKILYPMLLDGLVFETLDSAKVYRRFVTQV